MCGTAWRTQGACDAVMAEMGCERDEGDMESGRDGKGDMEKESEKNEGDVVAFGCEM